MIKEIGLLKRKPGMSPEEFSKAWRDFAPTVFSNYPGIRKYVQNVAIHLPSAEPPAYDGVAEAWWDNVESFLAAAERTRSKEGQGLINALAQFADLSQMVVILAEERVIRK
jgi:uncharacterized protein (TIGR02118 family)